MLTYRLLRRHQNNIIVCIYLCGQFLKNRKVANSDENYRCAATTIRALGAFKPSPIRENALTCYTDIKNPETVMQALILPANCFGIAFCRPLSLRWLEFQTIRRSDQLGGIGSKSRLFSSHYHNERINPSLSQIYPTLFKKSILCR